MKRRHSWILLLGPVLFSFTVLFNSRMKYALEIGMKNGIRPLKAETLKIKMSNSITAAEQKKYYS
ncbi:MAG: hypothetical protein WAM14_16270 [Candidatus Nitrosopolaris sp.]